MTTGFRRREASDEGRLLELRLGLAAWLGGLGLEPHQADDVMLATCEAMTTPSSTPTAAARGRSTSMPTSATAA